MTASKSHSSPRWGAGGNPEQGEWAKDASTHSTRFPALDRPLFDSIFVRDALDGTDGLPPEEGWWHIVHRDEMASLVEQNETLRQALIDYGQHAAWRCEYRNRYGSCQCGLDELMTSLGLPVVAVNDPEAKVSNPASTSEAREEAEDA